MKVLRDEMRRYFKLYGAFLRICAVREMEARGNFFVGSFLLGAFSLLPLLFIGAIYRQTPSLGGWSLYQYLTLVGTFQIMNSLLYGLFARNMFDLMEQIRKGGLDFFLLKPVNNQFLLSTRFVLFNELPGVIPGIFLVGLSIVNLHLIVDWWRWPLYLIFMVSGMVIAYSIWFMTVIPSIWLIKLDAPEVFVGIFDISRYHPSMFGGYLRVILVYLFPIGIVVSTPADIIMGRLDWTSAVWALLASAITLYISNRFWRFALLYYHGASS